jgi:general secretion pathway protein I
MNARNRDQGFTLLEVLIALAIIAIACMAIMKAVNDGVLVTTRLQNSAGSHWVAANVVANLRNGQLALPAVGSPLSGKQQLLNHTWRWLVSANGQVVNQYVHPVIVNVFLDRQKQAMLTHIYYIFSPPQGYVKQ